MEPKQIEQLISQLQRLLEQQGQEPEEALAKSSPFNEITIAKLCKTRRKVLGLQQVALAELAGVSLMTVKKLERGDLSVTLTSLRKVLEVVGAELCLRIK